MARTSVTALGGNQDRAALGLGQPGWQLGITGQQAPRRARPPSRQADRNRSVPATSSRAPSRGCCSARRRAGPAAEEVYRVLVEVVEAVREGKVITLVPRTQRLTTQEAADFLGISRPTMVKLLEDGMIPYEQPGRHRRILFTDLLAYTGRQHAERRAALDRMTEDASEAGIYGGTPEDYAAALKKARRRAARQENGS